MGSAYGQVTDYMFSGAIQVPASALYGENLRTSLARIDSNVALTDNFYTPGQDMAGDSVVAIGRNSLEDATATTSRVFLNMGAMRIQEEFDVPVLILSRGQGPEQKPIRDKAIGLLDAFIHFVQQDLTLNNILQGGRSASISDYQITQTETEDDQADGAMQTVEIALALHCANHYTP